MSSSIDLDIIIEEIEKFEHNDCGDDLSTPLEEYLQLIALTGDPLLPWNTIKGIVRFKLLKVINEFYDLFGGEELVDTANTPPFSYLPTRTKIMQHFDSFVGAPFTIQRLCEIIIDPKRHYKRTDKLLRGLEKNIYVVSFIEPGYSKHCTSLQEDGDTTQIDRMANGIKELSDVQISTSSLSDSPKISVSDRLISSETSDIDIPISPHSDGRINGSSIIANGLADDESSSSSSSPSSSTSSSPTPDEDSREPSGPSPKRIRLDIGLSAEERTAKGLNTTQLDETPSIQTPPSSSCKNSSGDECEREVTSMDENIPEKAESPQREENPVQEHENFKSTSDDKEISSSDDQPRRTCTDSYTNEPHVEESCDLTAVTSASKSSTFENMEVVESSNDTRLDGSSKDDVSDDGVLDNNRSSSLEGSPDSAQDGQSIDQSSSETCSTQVNC